MKKGIHPEMKLVTVKCASCGAEHTFWTTRENIKIDVCSNCHPFYQGKGAGAVIVDTEGRIEKFRKKFGESYLKA